MDINACTPDLWAENEEPFLRQLKNQTVWNKIPLLNVNELHNFKDASLVRFRGMIQDMHSPEYYLEKFEVFSEKEDLKTSRNGKYCDSAILNGEETVNYQSNLNITSERFTYVVVSIPGINDWVQILEEQQFKIKNEPTVNTKSVKRPFEETMDSEDAAPSTSADAQKKTCGETELKRKDTSVLSKEHILNFPLPNRTGKVCHLKVYQNQDDLKLNDLCEFVGFLAIDSVTEAAWQEVEGHESKMELEVLHPPSSLVPRIHCVSFKKLKHNNPLLNDASDMLASEGFDFLRKELLIVLTQLLLGDQLAAEYLLLHLISGVYIRRDCMPLGEFSLNISNIPTLKNHDFVSELYKFVELLIPKSHYLPMTLENMNDLAFTPKKDYECNRLTSGILQLTPNTHVVLDETKLCNGKLNSSGIDSLKALSNAIKFQTVMYDFNYFPLEFDCDIPFLILSEGKSILNVHKHVVLKPESSYVDTFGEIVEAARFFLKPELLNDLRKYLTLARLSKYEISNDIERLVQTEFVNMRQEGAVTVEDFHSLLVIARLVAISQGDMSLDEECWKKARHLERERKARLA